MRPEPRGHSQLVVLLTIVAGSSGVPSTLTKATREHGVIDVVECFRKPEEIVPVAEEAVAIGARCLWMQLGVVNEAAAQIARKAGMMVVMDRCMKIEHMALASNAAGRQ